jgi:hypothetical protein
MTTLGGLVENIVIPAKAGIHCPIASAVTFFLDNHLTIP